MVFVVLVIKEDVFFYIEWIIIFKSFQYTLSYFFPVKILVGIGEESEDSGRGTTGERTGDDIGAVLYFLHRLLHFFLSFLRDFASVVNHPVNSSDRNTGTLCDVFYLDFSRHSTLFFER